MIETLVQQLINGAVLGAIYAVIAIGYTLIFGVGRIIFFAQGDLSMVAAVTMLFVMRTGSAHHWAYPVALLAGLVAGAAVAVAAATVSERFALRPLRRAPKTKQLIASLGVMLVLQNLVFLLVSSENLPFPSLAGEAALSAGGLAISPLKIGIVVVSFVSAALVWIVVEHSRFGLTMRAVADNPENAQRVGIDCDRVIRQTFVLGGIVAAVAGVLLASYDSVVRFDMGFLPGLSGFTSAVLGGLGSIRGAVVGGLTLGIIESIGAGYVSSDYQHVITFAVLIFVLAFRRRGLVESASSGSPP